MMIWYTRIIYSFKQLSVLLEQFQDSFWVKERAHNPFFNNVKLVKGLEILIR